MAKKAYGGFVGAVFVILLIAFAAATFIFPFISTDLLRYTFITWFLLLIVIASLGFVFLSSIQRRLFFEDYQDTLDIVFNNIGTVVSALSVVTIIDLLIIKAKGVGHLKSLIGSDVFAQDWYQGFLTWIRTYSISKNGSALADTLDVNRTFRWFADILPKPDSGAYYAVFVVAVVLAIGGFIYGIRENRGIGLTVLNYLIFAPLLLLLFILIAEMVVTMFVSLLPLALLFIFGVSMFSEPDDPKPEQEAAGVGGAAESKAAPEWMYSVHHSLDDPGEYRVVSFSGSYAKLCDEHRNEFDVYMNPGNPNRYHDNSGNEYVVDRFV